MSAKEMTPSRTIFQVSAWSTTMVEASAEPRSPMSRMSGRRAPSCSKTWVPLVHEGWPETLALVPVMGAPNSSMRPDATALRGQRKAMRPVLPVTFNGRRCAVEESLFDLWRRRHRQAYLHAPVRHESCDWVLRRRVSGWELFHELVAVTRKRVRFSRLLFLSRRQNVR